MSERNGQIEVSVLCLAYNHEKYIRQTLDGFVSQKTTFRYEVIVHDDASTDRTAEIIKEYELKYPDIIKPIYQIENQHSKGIKITKNICMPVAMGKYIAFCEGDDYWIDSTKLQRQFDAMELHPECAICVHRHNSEYAGGRIEKIKKDWYDHDFMKDDVVLDDEFVASLLWVSDCYPFHTSSYFLRRTALKDYIDGTAAFLSNFTGDQIFLKMPLKTGSYYYINRVMSCYRRDVKNSWTDRFAKTPYENVVRHKINEMRGDYLVDRYLGGRFHSYIQSCNAHKVLKIALSWDVEEARQLIDELDITYETLPGKLMNAKRQSIRMLFYTLKHCPQLFSVLKKMWVLRNNNTEILRGVSKAKEDREVDYEPKIRIGGGRSSSLNLLYYIQPWKIYKSCPQWVS